MTDKELKHLSRRELLEMLLEQSRTVDRQKKRIKELEKELDDRRIICKRAGSIAEASLLISGVFEAAQQAADQYLLSIKAMEQEKADPEDEFAKMRRDLKL